MDASGAKQEIKKASRLRSPAYPGIDLEAALKRAQEIYDKERRGSANVKVILHHWGLKTTSSGGFIVIAALKSFGLIDDEGSGDSRTIKLSDLCLRILLDPRPDSTERAAALKTAALNPKIHSQLWVRYQGVLPSDANLRHELIFNRKFNENSVDEFIQEFKDTVSFAKLSSSDSINDDQEDKDEDLGEKNKETPQTVKIGDYVQWESNGQFQFREPKRVREISGDGHWAFVEGSNTGMPLGELTIEKPATEIPPKQTAPPVKTEPKVTPPISIEQKQLLHQELVVSIPRKFRVNVDVRGDELRKDDLARIKSQFTRWIEGLEEAFE